MIDACGDLRPGDIDDMLTRNRSMLAKANELYQAGRCGKGMMRSVIACVEGLQRASGEFLEKYIQTNTRGDQ